MELETYCTKLKVVKKKYCNSLGSEDAMQDGHINFVECSVCFMEVKPVYKQNVETYSKVTLL